MTRIRFDGCDLSPAGHPGSREATKSDALGHASRSVPATYAQPVRSFVLSVTGRDRPGIVAAVTASLLDHALNLEDAEMAILRGHFAVMLMLEAPDEVDEAGLRADLERVRTAVPLETVSLTEVPALDAPPRRPRTRSASTAPTIPGSSTASPRRSRRAASTSSA